MGRCYRKRRKKSKSMQISIIIDNQNYYRLFRWMKENNYENRNYKLEIKDFADTGRGIKACKNVLANTRIIAIPINLMITTSTVYKSYLFPLIQQYYVDSEYLLSPIETLSCFLLCEKLKGSESFWYFYISTLPQIFDLPLYWLDEDLIQLPSWCLYKAKQQIEQFSMSFNKMERLFIICESFNCEFKNGFTWENFKWAWSVINSRSVFINIQEKKLWLNSEPDNIALTPLLDMFNHSPEAQVEAILNNNTKCYELITRKKCNKNQQIFINYGSHDNCKLFIEYGFVCPNNPNDSILFELEDVFNAWKKVEKLLINYKEKLCFIKNKNLDKVLFCNNEGLSWNFKALLYVITNNSYSQYEELYENCSILYNQENVLVKKIFTFMASSTLNSIPNFATVNQNNQIKNQHKFVSNFLCKTYRGILEKSIQSL